MTQAAIDSIVQELVDMIQQGVTLANVKASLTNKGTTEHLATSLVRMAILKIMTTPEETLKNWRNNLSCEEQVKRQLSDEFANAETQEELDRLNKIWDLIYL
jgi:hypothetical protein